MKKISKAKARNKTVDSILGTLRIEKLQPSSAVISGMRSCVLGQESTQHLLQEAISSHVKIRRG
jgi:hypothetical protein